jgi:hypothetical protein
VLYAIPELAEHRLGDVRRALGHEIHADAFRANQADDLFDLLHERRRRVGEQEVRLVEKEHERRLLDVSDFRQMFEQLGEHPQQKGRVHLWRAN